MSKKASRSEGPRYLLPSGCKDLGEALKAARQEAVAKQSGLLAKLAPVTKRTVPLCLLAEPLEAHLRAAQDRAAGDDLFFIELSPHDHLGVWRNGLILVLRLPEWCADLDRVRRVAGEHGLTVRQESTLPESGTQLVFFVPPDPAALARLTVTLLEEGFGLPSDLPVKYQIQ